MAFAGEHTGWDAPGGSGVIGVGLLGLAVDAAFAAELEDTRGATALPLGRRGRGRAAMEGTLLEQAAAAVTEPGVRAQL